MTSRVRTDKSEYDAEEDEYGEGDAESRIVGVLRDVAGRVLTSVSAEKVRYVAHDRLGFARRLVDPVRVRFVASERLR